MSSQQIPNEQSEIPSIPPATSRTNPKIRIGLHSLPMEILGRIAKESMKEEEAGTNLGNITRNLPKFITSLKCGVNDPWRIAYIHTLDACSRDWVYSLHFGNKWKLPMDSEEGGLVRNIVIKYLPEIWENHHSHYSPFRPTQTVNNASEVDESAGQVPIVKDLRFYYWHPMPEVVNSSLDNLPNVRSIQLEFKTFCVSFGAKSLGLYRTFQSFLGDHKEFKLKSATIEPTSRVQWPDMQRIVIPQVTVMAGHDVCFDLTDKGIWVLKAFTTQTDARAETVHLDLENNMDSETRLNLFNVVQVLRGCKWTWVLEREEKKFSSLEIKD
ncbi:uncharacterized protein EAF01_006419 [Botrytis porri]|uniref:Uncharacterized protein n=1 Tax=Botrytis porri TaxID=87229 RepID=A0A4Z1KLS6_9HELO|nr:uncharacterized protein EAF01_006419 [Botrytis porri]KAF7903370.1 hypothetical protein EAF01_006419 [Botrytis porri]TGO82339.1 hypothetical protein BPOR_0856g00010 [Botrytis porri]